MRRTAFIKAITYNQEQGCHQHYPIDMTHEKCLVNK